MPLTPDRTGEPIHDVCTTDDNPWRHFRLDRLLGGRFMAHQLAGIQFMLDRNRCLCSDGTGLGKTVMALGLVARLMAAGDRGSSPRVLIVIPAALEPQWTAEARKYLQGLVILGADRPRTGTKKGSPHLPVGSVTVIPPQQR